MNTRRDAAGRGVGEANGLGAWPLVEGTAIADVLEPTSVLNLYVVPATIELAGVRIGTDKLAHFFSEGALYYRFYRSALEDGLSEEAAELRDSPRVVRGGLAQLDRRRSAASPRTAAVV